jgi:ABC-type transport system involved in multi-copper enzyme maturation permease subunit
MLTADCLSRERREGTLGLLFLTPLKGTDIVVAKVLAQGLRAITLGLAVLPVLTIPFLLGGVSWTDAALSVMVNFNAMCWALAAGLLASAWNKAWLRALLWAAILAVAFFLILTTGGGWILLHTLSAMRPGQFEMSLDRVLDLGFGLLVNFGDWAGNTRWVWASTLVWVLGQTTFFSLLVLVAAVLAAGAKTRRCWQEEPPSRRQVWLRRTFCTPVLWLSFFRWWMRRKLERNPIGWLEQRTWSGRLVTWGWFAVMISIYSAVLTDQQWYYYYSHDANHWQEIMAWLLTGSMALSAAASFRRERETGVLELLLVSPLSERRIISGRLRGLWGQFLPAFGLLLAVGAYLSSFQPDLSSFLPNASGAAGVILFFAVTFLTVPVFGLYFSLRCRNFLTAFLSTVAVGLLLPVALPALLRGLRALLEWEAYSPSGLDFSEMRECVAAVICQGILAVFCCRRLYRRLEKRAFPLERTEA